MLKSPPGTTPSVRNRGHEWHWPGVRLDGHRLELRCHIYWALSGPVNATAFAPRVCLHERCLSAREKRRPTPPRKREFFNHAATDPRPKTPGTFTAPKATHTHTHRPNAARALTRTLTQTPKAQSRGTPRGSTAPEKPSASLSSLATALCTATLMRPAGRGNPTTPLCKALLADALGACLKSRMFVTVISDQTIMAQSLDTWTCQLYVNQR